jgi:hypothetical protein
MLSNITIDHISNDHAANLLAISRMHGFFQSEYIDTQLKGNPNAAPAILMVVAIRVWAGQHAFVDYMRDKWATMKDIVDRLGPDFPKKIRAVNSTEDGYKLALEAKKALAPKPPAPPPPPAPESKPEQEDLAPAPEDEPALNGCEQSSGQSNEHAGHGQDDPIMPEDPMPQNDMPPLTDDEPPSAGSEPQPDEDDDDDDDGKKEQEPSGEEDRDHDVNADPEDEELPGDQNEPDDRDIDDEDARRVNARAQARMAGSAALEAAGFDVSLTG